MKKNFIGYYILGSAIIWGAVIIFCAILLKDTDCYPQISTMLGSGAGIHLILIWGPLAANIKKFRETYEKTLEEK